MDMTPLFEYESLPSSTHPTRSMKPRHTLAETKLPDGTSLVLQEHDARHYLIVQGQQIAGPATQPAEEELARLACAPFRPARQPKILLVGLALGHALAAVAAELTQKRANFIVAEPLAELAAWHHKHLPKSPLNHDSRVTLVPDPSPSGLAKHAGSLHAIIIHLDASPTTERNRPWVDDRRWLAAAYEALQAGGLLAIAASRPIPSLTRRLQRCGFAVAEHLIPLAPNAKKTRLQPIWLARKGKAFE
jgi:spermidine synthase